MVVEKIISEGIYYINDFGENEFLSFEKCNENWLAYRKRTELLNKDQIDLLKETDKTVGQRDISIDQNYIEFFTRPFTRFVFNIPEQEEEYSNLRDSIILHGWKTYDLS